MSRNPRPNRSGAGAYPPPTTRYEEYEDDYPSTSRYYSNDPPANPGASRRGGDQRGRAYDAGGSAASSSGASLLDRMKVKSYETSRTSLEDDYESKPRQPTAPTWARKPGAAAAARHQQQQRIPEERRQVVQQTAPSPDPGSAGSTLWGRVVNAAGSLTISIPVAWNSSSSDGPETPPGGETRLTKVMKQYYIERARSPLDLPHWLFEEHERMPTVARQPQRGPRRYDEGEDEQNTTLAPPTRGALRDVYDKAASKTSARSTPTPQSARSNTSSYPGSPGSDPSPTESKATSRLRALRDAKRMQQGGAVAASTGASSYTSNRYDEEYANDGGRRSMEPASDVERRQPARVGLPSRPGGRYN